MADSPVRGQTRAKQTEKQQVNHSLWQVLGREQSALGGDTLTRVVSTRRRPLKIEEEVFAEGHTELRGASGVSLGLSTTAEDIKTKVKNDQTAPFDSRFPSQSQTRNSWQNYLDFHRCEKAMTAKRGEVSCANGTGVCTSPSAPCPGWQPGTTAGRKARFLGRSELAPPTSPPYSILLLGQ